MNKKIKYWVYGLFCLAVILLAVGPQLHGTRQHAQQATHHEAASRPVQQPASSQHLRTPIDWRKSSETVPYPDLDKVKDLWVKVDLKGNRTYLYDGQKVIYTMYSTGGIYEKDAKTGKMKSATPTGTFHVQQERGDSFYNAKLQEGANYYTSWLNHGEYLFHSVPTKADGSYNQKEAAKLGKTQGSHGCIRLSVPDARWMEQHLPVGTKVVIVG
ncbi:MAG: L,D-transpeptidase [Limosilactobacillus sp.]